MATVSKEALIFQNRIKSFDEDLEMVDILKIALRNNDLLKENNKLFKYTDSRKHVQLCSRAVTDQSRNIIVYHLRKTVYSSYLKDLYEELTGYLKSLLTEAAKLSKDKTKAGRLLGEHNISIKAIDILQYSTIEDLTVYVAESIIQALENERSTKDLILKICRKTDISVSNEIIDSAMPYLDIRHKLVHTNGKLDDDFHTKYPQIECDEDSNVALNYSLIRKAKDSVTALVLAIDEKAIEKGILSPNTA